MRKMNLIWSTLSILGFQHKGEDREATTTAASRNKINIPRRGTKY